MVLMLGQITGIGAETADMLVHEVLSPLRFSVGYWETYHRSQLVIRHALVAASRRTNSSLASVGAANARRCAGVYPLALRLRN
jgi:hypothetical protein